MNLRVVTFIGMIFMVLPMYSQPVANDCAVNNNDDTHSALLKCISDYTILAGKPVTNKYSKVSSLKLVYVLEEKQLYFTNSNKFQFHYEFCSKVLGDSIDLSLFNDRNYHIHPKRKYLLVNLNYYEDQKKYIVELFPGEETKGEWIFDMLTLLRESMPDAMKLAVLDNNPVFSQAAVLPEKIELISSDDVYANQSFQCLKAGTAYGYLRKISSKEISKASIDPHDIVILDNLPLHLPWVQTVITSVFQTPLSHINVLCSNRGIPNCSWKSVWNNKNVDKYVNTLVKVQVREDRVLITPANLTTAQSFWKAQENKQAITLTTDLSVDKVVRIDKVKKLSISSVGAKAYNFSHLASINCENGKPVMTPENAFVIPFHFYAKHIHDHCIQELIDSVKPDSEPEKIKAGLKKIRKAIESSAVDSLLIKEVLMQMSKDKRYKNYRFRSSTNAEDIEGFNGAGLYESHTGSLSDSKKKPEDAIRKVWASLWNYNAYMEREYFNISHSGVAMGILVHRSFGDDYANGVAITRHLYRSGYPAYTVNVQLGETSVVSPVDSITAAQFILIFKGFENEDSYSLDYITHSSLAKEKEILTPAQLKQLVSYLRAIKKYFYFKEKSEVYFYNYGLDIEFKVDAQSGKVYIKQVRPYSN
jgi:pyruvate, water dikinase